MGYYLRYNLSYREVQESYMIVALTFLIRRFIVWVQEYGKLLYQIWKRKIKNPFIHGKWMKRTSKLKEMALFVSSPYGCRWFNLGYWLRKKRDTQAAYAFLKRLVKQFDEPKVSSQIKPPLLQVPLRN